MIFRMGKNETVLTLSTQKHLWLIQDMKAIPGKFQHALVVADTDEKT